MAARRMMALTDDERAMLELERQWFAHRGSKEGRILERFGLSPTRYHQVLLRLIDREDALAHDPILVKRLRRLRTKRAASRTARRVGDE
ncbi:hypothetical protein HMPREF0063_10030 [Aeromicrobium marinum DSM 15272]|uniref:DUF3263 domain-containing protein n=1 Tax=Aeromicrobium marinum DSM 15272 TaxID=585531 RepID=E2S7M3_9ACTN|nr:DUF3263 domain-containing protein [Aeromicrobium marinum]EFQ84689.1 hypothetical protein HMPREF0063_10030 [Aeromicrobium marinum DSM 15272]